MGWLNSCLQIEGTTMASRNPSSARDCPTSLTVKLGSWFEARATGWGVAAIPVLLVLAAAMAASHLVLK